MSTSVSIPEKGTMIRARLPKRARAIYAIQHPEIVTAERCRRRLFSFMQEFWSEVSSDEPIWNWHIPYICSELELVARRVAAGLPREYDLIINIPPGTTKSTTCTIMFPVWCWTNWPWMRFIASSYAGSLSLEHAEASRDLVRSARFKAIYPHLEIKQDKDTKSNFRVIERLPDGTAKLGGSRFSTSVGGAVTGYHGHILLVDDPLDPRRAHSPVELETANRWMSQTLSTRKIDKAVTPTILIQQRLHQNDCTGHTLAKKKGKKVKHLCLPGEIRAFPEMVKPAELAQHYTDDLLDPNRMNWSVLSDMETDLGQYGYAGQIGQNPVPPGGGMFKVDNIAVVDQMPAESNFVSIVRFWDKAGTTDGGAYTAGVKIAKLISRAGYWYLVMDVKRGQWSSEVREDIILTVAQADGVNVKIGIEQEPGSGGKESAESTVRNLAGFNVFIDRPTGDKVFRADPFSVQVNHGNVRILRGDWNHDFIEELRFFPAGTYKDQVDAAAAAFNRLAGRKEAKMLDAYANR